MVDQSRRRVIKAGAAIGVGALLASKLPAVYSAAPGPEWRGGQDAAATEYRYNEPDSYIHSTCLQCHVACPIRVKVQKGVAVKIDGNPYSPQNRLPHFDYDTTLQDASRRDGKLCPAGLSGLHTLYDPYRLTTVLKRAGARGSNRWQTISFDQAVREIVEGGDLFGEGHVDGLGDVLALRDPAVAKAMAEDVRKVQAREITVDDFKSLHRENLEVLIDPDHPDKGPKNNQFTGMIGRAEHGRKEFLKRFIFDTFGSPNYIDHYNICEQSHHVAYEFMTDQFDGGTWDGGAEHMKPDLLHAEFVIFFGTGAFEANFGKTPMAEKVTRSLRERNFKMAVADPRLSKTAAKAEWWLPVKPGGDAALALGMMRRIFERGSYDGSYLENANRAAAAQDGEPTWSSATYLVRIDDGRPSRFLRASDAGLGSQDQLVISRGGRLIAVTPDDEESPLHGDLFAEATVDGVQAKTSLRLLREEAESRTSGAWADLCGVSERQIAEVADEFTSHGKKAAAEFYRGPAQHANGFYNSQAIISLNFLIGNVDYKGGLSKGGGHWHESGGKPGSVYTFKEMHPDRLTKFGMTQSRQGWRYEDTTLFRDDGYPARRPFYPFSSGMYSEVLPSAADGYPYPLKVLFLHMGTPALSIPGATQFTVDTLRDTEKVPLFVASDIVVGETSMYADYIIPDVTYLERWGTPHVTPDVQTATSKVRQPAASPLTEAVTVDGEEMPISMEAFLIAVAKRLGLSGVGENGFGDGIPFNRPEDFYLKAVANLAAGDKAGDTVPDASDAEMELFLAARRHLPRSVFDPAKWQAAVPAELWRKVVYVLNRGGRYENFSGAYQDNLTGHRFGKMVNFFVEKVAGTRNSISGEPFHGLAHYQPVTGADGRVVDDSDYPFALITYKEVYFGHSRQASNYWTLAVLLENGVLMNRRDAESLGVKDGDMLRLASRSNPSGTVDLGDETTVTVEGRAKVLEGIRPGTVAVSWHFGHWNAYGGSDKITIDGERVTGDPRRAAGLVPNPLMRVDDYAANAGLTDPVGGSASWYDTRVSVTKV